MPDLSWEAVSAWLRTSEPALGCDVAPHLYSAVDEPQVLPPLLHFGVALDHADRHDPKPFESLLQDRLSCAQLQHVLASVGQGRRLYLLHWLSQRNTENDFMRGLFEAGDTPAAHYLRAEIRSLHRRALLTRIFSPERIQALLLAAHAQRERAHYA